MTITSISKLPMASQACDHQMQMEKVAPATLSIYNRVTDFTDSIAPSFSEESRSTCAELRKEISTLNVQLGGEDQTLLKKATAMLNVWERVVKRGSEKALEKEQDRRPLIISEDALSHSPSHVATELAKFESSQPPSPLVSEGRICLDKIAKLKETILQDPDCRYSTYRETCDALQMNHFRLIALMEKQNEDFIRNFEKEKGIKIFKLIDSEDDICPQVDRAMREMNIVLLGKSSESLVNRVNAFIKNAAEMTPEVILQEQVGIKSQITAYKEEIGFLSKKTYGKFEDVFDKTKRQLNLLKLSIVFNHLKTLDGPMPKGIKIESSSSSSSSMFSSSIK